MHWFVDEMLWHEASFTLASTRLCATFCKNTKINTTCIFLPLPNLQDYDVLFDIHIVSQYLMSNGGGCKIWFYRYVEFLNKTSTPYLLVVKESTATMSVRSWHLYIQYIISGNKTVTLQPRLPLAVRRKSSKSTSLKPINKKTLCRKHHCDLQYCELAKGSIKLRMSVWSPDGHQMFGAIDLW